MPVSTFSSMSGKAIALFAWRYLRKSISKRSNFFIIKAQTSDRLHCILM
jgi:hypothetical protein